MLEERAICCDDVRVRASGAGAELPRSGQLKGDAGPLPEPTRVTSAYFEASQLGHVKLMRHAAAVLLCSSARECQARLPYMH